MAGRNEVAVRVTGKDAGATRVLRGVKKEATGLAGGLQTLQKNWLAAGAAVGVAAGAFRVVGGMISSASDLTESIGKSNIVFGEFAKGITAWSETSATAMGLSQQAALEAAGTFGNLLTAMGLTQQAAAPLSMSIVELATDLGAFNNIAGDEALLKLRAGLVGEAEPLRTLGINISAATTELKAMEMGLISTKSELTDAIKIQARWALILEQSTNAQGNFGDTSGDLAGQLKILDAQWEDMKATLGTALIPAVTDAVVALNALFDVVKDLTAHPLIEITVRVTRELVERGGGLGPTLTRAFETTGIGQMFQVGQLSGRFISGFLSDLTGGTGGRSEFAEGITSEEVGGAGTVSGRNIGRGPRALSPEERGLQFDRFFAGEEKLRQERERATTGVATLSAAEQARSDIITQQTNQVIEAFLQEQMGAEGRVAAVRQEQQELDSAWADIAAGLGDIGVLIPDEFRGMWESMQEIQKQEQQALLDQRKSFAEQARIAEQKILAGTADVSAFAFALGARRDPDLSPAESAAAQAERDRFGSFLDRLLSGEVAPTMDSITSKFGEGMASVLANMIAHQQLFIDALGNIRPVFVVQIGSEVIEDAVVIANEGLEASGRTTKTLVD
jgi:hypothetical protein